MSARGLLQAAGIAGLSMLAAAPAIFACPFCESETPLSYSINNSAVAVIARLVRMPTPAEIENAPAGQPALATFAIEKVLKGKELLDGKSQLELVYYNDDVKHDHFLVMGHEPEDLFWGTPTPLSAKAATYVSRLPKLPKEGADRLAFFQDFLNDDDKLLAKDAFAEFSQAPYSSVKQLGPRVRHDDVLAWVQDPKVAASQRRLYLVLLAVHRRPEDAAVIESLIAQAMREGKPQGPAPAAPDAQPVLDSDWPFRRALDSLVACYLTLKGPAGMDLVTEMLADERLEFSDRYALIRSLQFHGQEEQVIPREQIIATFHKLLDDRKTAEMVIKDLGRWGDWSVMDRLATMYREVDDDNAFYLREPIASYLLSCPLPKAKALLVELAEFDPTPIEHARRMSVPVGPIPPPEPGPADVAAAALPASEQANGRQSQAATPVTWRNTAIALAAVLAVVVAAVFLFRGKRPRSAQEQPAGKRAG